MTNRDVNETIKRIRALKKAIENNTNLTEEEREDDLNMLYDLVDCMCQYTTAAFKEMKKGDIRNQMMRDGKPGEEVREMGKQLDQNRISSHDKLLRQTRIIDSICREYGLPEIYGNIPEEYMNDISGLIGSENRKKPGVVEARHGLANWTWDFILSCTICMDLETDIKLDDLDFENNYADLRQVADIYDRVDRNYGVKKIMHGLIDEER